MASERQPHIMLQQMPNDTEDTLNEERQRSEAALVQVAELTGEVKRLKDSLERATGELRVLRNSTSWRVTAPLRLAKSAIVAADGEFVRQFSARSFSFLKRLAPSALARSPLTRAGKLPNAVVTRLLADSRGIDRRACASARTRMRIMIDLQSCQSYSRFGGIGRYSLALAKAMIREAPNDEFIVAMNNRYQEGAEKVIRELKDVLPPSNIVFFEVPPWSAYTHQAPTQLAAAERAREQFLNKLHPDFIHVTSLFEGLTEEIVTSVSCRDYPLTAVTLYDLIPLLHEDIYLTDKIARQHYFAKLTHLSRAQLLLAISQYSADEIGRVLPNFKGSIVNVSGGVDDRFATQPPSMEARLRVLAKYGINGGFMLYVANFDYRKNHARLTQALAKVSPDLRKECKLVLVGTDPHGTYENVISEAVKCGLRESDVVFIGRVTDAELAILYSSCRLFVFPSLCEGFGLPMLEAMACGAPVIASAGTSIGEVLGREDASFDPTDVSSIAGKIEEVLTDELFLQDLRRYSLERVKAFTWTASAKRALTALRETYTRCI